MESRGPWDSKNVKTSQAYFFEGFISFFEDFSLTTRAAAVLSRGLSIVFIILPAYFSISKNVLTLQIPFLCLSTAMLPLA